MKKKLFVLAVSIVSSLALMTGCGNKENSASENGVAGSLGVAGGNWEYVATYKDIFTGDEDKYATSYAMANGKVYYIDESYDSSSAENFDVAVNTMHSVDMETGEETEKKLEISCGDSQQDFYITDMVVDENENMYLIAVGYVEDDAFNNEEPDASSEEDVTDADVTDVDAQEVMDDGDETDATEEPGDIEDSAESEESDEIGYETLMQNEMLIYLFTMSSDGEILNGTDITGVFTYDDSESAQLGISVYPSCATLGDNGEIFVYDSYSYVHCFDTATGEKKYDIEVSGYATDMCYYDGELILTGYLGDMQTESIMVYDTASELFTSYEGLEDIFVSKVVIGEDGNIYVSSDNDFYLYDKDNASATKVLNWMATDIYAMNICDLLVKEDGTILVLINEYEGDTQELYLATLTYSEVTDETRREEITLSGYYVTDELNRAILKFNRSQTDYRVVFYEYDEQGDLEYDELLEMMETDFTGDEAPDILMVLDGFNIKGVVNQGYALDLSSYFNSSINPDDFVPGIFDAGRFEDGMYVIAPTFVLDTIVVNGEALGGETITTTAELCDFFKAYLAESADTCYMTRDDVLSALCQTGINEFIDWETGECNFQSDAFIDILEVCSAFPEEFDMMSIASADLMKMMVETPFMITSAGSVDVFQEYQALYENQALFLGVPVGEELKPYLDTSGMRMIASANTDCPDGVWAFIEFLLSEDIQDTFKLSSFPVNVNSLDKVFEEACTPTYTTDENGNTVEEMKYAISFDGVNIIYLYAADEEFADSIREQIDNAVGNTFSDDELTTIIQEEAAAYFEGQKTAEEVAEIIQSRAVVYVTENM